MLYYQGTTVSFQEVPDEVSLVILIGDCPHRCPGCHSPELWEARGKDLEHDLPSLIDQYADVITCVCFMGEGQDYGAMNRCIRYATKRGFKTCLYSGSNAYGWPPLTYLKTGPYIAELGGLDSSTTNQRFWRIYEDGIVDMTHLFQKKKE